MLSTERQAFEEQLAILFSGFPTFLTPPRVEAYWTGLQKMPLQVFVRCVEQALGEDGEEKLPTPNAIWKISKRLRASPPPKPAPVIEPTTCRFKRYGNRALLAWLCKYGPVAEHTLALLVREKNRLCEAYEVICEDEPEASKELKGKLMEAFTRVLLADRATATQGDLLRKAETKAQLPTSNNVEETHHACAVQP